MFTGHEFADGAATIKNTLHKSKIKASFFLTGDFYRKFSKIAVQLQKDKHYLGPHSDKHLLYASWTKRDSTLVAKPIFIKDIMHNYTAMKQVGININTPLYFLPAYEWYNKDISNWVKEKNVQLVNFTPGTGSNADYTTPEMKNYQSSNTIYEKIIAYETKNGLNGFLLLLHIGTDAKRTDKFYFLLDDLIKELKKRGYVFKRIDELLR